MDERRLWMLAVICLVVWAAMAGGLGWLIRELVIALEKCGLLDAMIGR